MVCSDKNREYLVLNLGCYVVVSMNYLTFLLYKVGTLYAHSFEDR